MSEPLPDTEYEQLHTYCNEVYHGDALAVPTMALS
jgi:hypothetical protein